MFATAHCSETKDNLVRMHKETGTAKAVTGMYPDREGHLQHQVPFPPPIHDAVWTGNVDVEFKDSADREERLQVFCSTT